jgi:D-aspartate ligase
MSTDRLPPAIVLGGDENALSVVRNLSRAGIEVFVVNRPGMPARYSRYGCWLDTGGGSPRDWREFLLGPRSEHLRGAVIFTCGDEAIELVAQNFSDLSSKFRLEESPPDVRRRLLDKLSTYECAREAGVPAPGFWFPQSNEDLARTIEECRFPAILKPRRSYDAAKLGRKYLRANSVDELKSAYARLCEFGIPSLVMEVIPGSDDRLCSYYSYYDEAGTPLIRFTKRHPRRYPVGEGRATYHVTTWNEEVADLGDRFFRHAGLRGLGNIEFKRDDRDGKLKIIESNARFTAADALVTRSGVDFANFTYNRLTGRASDIPKGYRSGMVLWYPLEDFLSFLALRRRGDLSWMEWIRSVSKADLFPYMRWDDPLPGIVNLAQRARSAVRASWREVSAAAPALSGGLNDNDRAALSRSGRAGAR